MHLAPVHFLDPAVDVKVIAGHWPLREWDGWHSGAIHIHGHTHGNLPSSRRSIDVGVDAVGAIPMTIQEIHLLREDLPELDFRGVEVAAFVKGGAAPEDDTTDGYGR